MLFDIHESADKGGCFCGACCHSVQHHSTYLCFCFPWPTSPESIRGEYRSGCLCFHVLFSTCCCGKQFFSVKIISKFIKEIKCKLITKTIIIYIYTTSYGFQHVNWNILYHYCTLQKQVLVTKSVEFMPFYLSFFTLVSSVLWMAYGLLGRDLFIAVSTSIVFHL